MTPAVLAFSSGIGLLALYGVAVVALPDEPRTDELLGLFLLGAYALLLGALAWAVLG